MVIDKFPREIEDCIEKYVFTTTEKFSRTKDMNFRRCEEQLYGEKRFEKLYRDLENKFSILKGKRILEIGSGSGERSVAFALAGSSVIGIEPNYYGLLASLLRAHRYPRIKVNFCQSFGENLPFKDNTFDMVVSFEVLEHVKDIDRVIAECFRVLKKGGIIYCETANNLFPYEGHYRMFWPPLLPKSLGKIYARLKNKDPSHLDTIHYITKFGLIMKFRKQGYSKVSLANVSYLLEKIGKPDSVETPYKRRIIRISR